MRMALLATDAMRAVRLCAWACPQNVGTKSAPATSKSPVGRSENLGVKDMEKPAPHPNTLAHGRE